MKVRERIGVEDDTVRVLLTSSEPRSCSLSASCCIDLRLVLSRDAPRGIRRPHAFQFPLELNDVVPRDLLQLR